MVPETGRVLVLYDGYWLGAGTTDLDGSVHVRHRCIENESVSGSTL